MEFMEALEIVIANTGHEAYRALCREDNPNVEQRNACRQTVVRKASGQIRSNPRAEHQSLVVRPSLAEASTLLKAMKACLYRSNFPPCGCQGGRCSLRRGEIVSHRDCFECIRRFAPASIQQA